MIGSVAVELIVFLKIKYKLHHIPFILYLNIKIKTDIEFNGNEV